MRQAENQQSVAKPKQQAGAEVCNMADRGEPVKRGGKAGDKGARL